MSRYLRYRSTTLIRKFSSTKLPDYNTPVEIDKIKLQWRRKDLDGQSLIADTLKAMNDEKKASGNELKITLDEKKTRRRALDNLGIPGFTEFVALKLQSDEDGPAKTHKGNISELTKRHQRGKTEILQLNIGLYCNQACSHCHVESSPKRKEMMSTETAEQCLKLLAASPNVKVLDITGGAPELNSSFRYLVREARKLRPDVDIIDRCNLTVVHEPGQEDLIEFLAGHCVHIVASLPCYSAKNVNLQRGKGVFDRSISALLAFNEVGYGINESLQLDLVYNPLGAFLPPPQEKLSIKYKEELLNEFGINFNNLYTMTNMPIKRFADFLHRRGELESYMDLLVRNFNINTLSGLMCRNTVSVGWDGRIYDCDFNQQLGLHIDVGVDKIRLDTDRINQRQNPDICSDSNNSDVAKQTRNCGPTRNFESSVFSLQSLDDLKNYDISYDNHCFGCTAGMGSS